MELKCTKRAVEEEEYKEKSKQELTFWSFQGCLRREPVQQRRKLFPTHTSPAFAGMENSWEKYHDVLRKTDMEFSQER
ncbi:hypothetical protein E2C01_086370 [Portunus trituberculatus]|uniref:Uncharacterized protein n=1 Tax=Portunus trituberculatus TaxID=210409 RepID=A0A5B7J584_PORTR|nr:hypothetical protein [Portunus trituberculatus]